MRTMVVPVILAAGCSTRMRRPKSLCDFDGKTALALALAACRDGGAESPVVVLGHSRGEVQAAVSLDGADVVINEDFERGPISSLKCGLSRLAPDVEAFMIYPVDHPLIRAEDVRAIIDAYAGNRGKGKRIYIPSYGLKRGHPIIVDAELRGDFESLADDRTVGMLIDLHAARIHYVEVSRPYVLMDMDTPEEYDRCLAEYRKRERIR